jgi:hypothetical protein
LLPEALMAFFGPVIFGSDVKGFGRRMAMQAGSFPYANRSTQRSHFCILRSVSNWGTPKEQGRKHVRQLMNTDGLYKEGIDATRNRRGKMHWLRILF